MSAAVPLKMKPLYRQLARKLYIWNNIWLSAFSGESIFEDTEAQTDHGRVKGEPKTQLQVGLETVRMLSSAWFIWLLCWYLYKRSTFVLQISFHLFSE